MRESDWVTFSKMVYMSSSFGLLALASCDLSQAEKEITSCKAEQIHKMAFIFTQNGCHFVNFLSFANSNFFSAWDKPRDPTGN